MTSIRPTSGSGLNALTEEWTAEIMTKPNEEGVLVSKFSRPHDTKKIGNQLHMTIVPTIPATELSASADPLLVTPDHQELIEVTLSSTFSYNYVEISDTQFAKMMADRAGKLKAAYRKQLLAGLNTKQDTEGGELASSLSTQLGGGNFDQTLLVQAKGTLVINAKEFVRFNDGVPSIHLVYHPTQMQYIDIIAGITQAYARGDKQNPAVKGVVHDAWGMSFAETGNVLVSGGFAYNLIFTPECFAIAYNEQPQLKAPQEYLYAVRILAKQEFGVAEVFDEAGVCVRTPV